MSNEADTGSDNPTKAPKVRYAVPAPHPGSPIVDMDLPEGMLRILTRAFEAEPELTYRDLEAAGKWALARDLKLAYEIRKKRAADAAAA